MSRNILQIHGSFQENPLDRTDRGKIILTDYRDTEIALLIQNNRLLAAHVPEHHSKIGAVYIGKVKKVAKSLNACFVEIADREICFLPFGEIISPFLLNRSFDGRILEGDEFPVQVTRDAIKSKQAAVTCNISLASDDFVFSLGSPQVGISSKLSKKQKAEIKDFLFENFLIDEKEFLLKQPSGAEYGAVIRTHAGKLFTKDPAVFMEQFRTQQAAFLQFLESTRHKTCFSVIQAPKIPYDAILDRFPPDAYEEVLTDLPEAYTSLQGHVERIRFYNDTTFPLKKLYSVETRLQDALGKYVWLKSGANLVIEQTECLTAIDVNSGKMNKGSENEEAIRKINEEAAREAALQIRLRNLSGIIIIDFINMKDKSAQDDLLKLMKELTASDNIPTTAVDITPLGLMEITRKKVNRSLKEQLHGIL